MLGATEKYRGVLGITGEQWHRYGIATAVYSVLLERRRPTTACAARLFGPGSLRRTRPREGRGREPVPGVSSLSRGSSRRTITPADPSANPTRVVLPRACTHSRCRRTLAERPQGSLRQALIASGDGNTTWGSNSRLLGHLRGNPVSPVAATCCVILSPFPPPSYEPAVLAA